MREKNARFSSTCAKIEYGEEEDEIKCNVCIWDRHGRMLKLSIEKSKMGDIWNMMKQ